MRFSSSFGTAIHTLLIIYERSKTQKVTSDVIAEIIGTSGSAIRRLLPSLKNAGFINIAPRKSKEGTTLALPLEKITLRDVFEAVEPNCIKDISGPCMNIAMDYRTGKYMNEIIHNYSAKALESTKIELSKTSMADVLAEIEKKDSCIPYENLLKISETDKTF